MLPLEGIKILDLSRLAPGPFCSMMLGDLGADVLLVEAPADGKLAGMILGQRNIDAEKIAAYNMMGRNKRSIVLNLREEDARKIFYRLADDADVVLEGFRPGVVKRLGVDYETLIERNPRLVYCSVGAYGSVGPLAHEPGYDALMQAAGGLISITGEVHVAVPVIGKPAGRVGKARDVEHGAGIGDEPLNWGITARQHDRPWR